MQVPPFLSAGDRVGITAPARWVDQGDLDFFVSALKGEGFVVETGSVYTKNNQFAGTVEQRLSDLQAMLDDPGIRAVFAARGGYGTGRLLEGIDLQAFAKHPKWIAGFSDITALHSAIMMKIGTAVLHCAMPYTLKDGGDVSGLESMLSVLKGELPSYEIPGDKLNRSGRGEGHLIGGNLSVLYSLTGTAYQLPTRGAVLFLEDVDEYLYHIDRMILNLKLAGMLEGLNGMIIGGMCDMNDNTVPFGNTAYEIIREAVEPYDFPVCFGFPAGHQMPNLAMVIGKEVHLEVGENGSYLDYITR